MSKVTKAIFDRLSELERATVFIVQEDKRAWKDAEIKKLEKLRCHFDKWELKDGTYQLCYREP